MTATDELRRLLDERGVEHYDGTETTLWLKDSMGYRASADEGMNGFIQLHLWCTTPEQAIAATLGRGTCEYAIKDNMNETEGMGDVWIECSACHFTFDYHGGKWLMNMYYCPSCGAKVVKQ